MIWSTFDYIFLKSHLRVWRHCSVTGAKMLHVAPFKWDIIFQKQTRPVEHRFNILNLELQLLPNSPHWAELSPPGFPPPMCNHSNPNRLHVQYWTTVLDCIKHFKSVFRSFYIYLHIILTYDTYLFTVN